MGYEIWVLIAGKFIGGFTVKHMMKSALRQTIERWEQEIKDKAVQDYILSKKHHD